MKKYLLIFALIGCKKEILNERTFVHRDTINIPAIPSYQGYETHRHTIPILVNPNIPNNTLFFSAIDNNHNKLPWLWSNKTLEQLKHLSELNK